MDGLVYAQAVQLLSALRKAMPSSRALSEDAFIHTAVAMLEELVRSPGTLPVDAAALVAPFLECLKSHEMSGPLVLLTVESVRKLIDNGLLDSHHFTQGAVGSGRAEFLLMLCKAVNGTRFEATEASQDEVALFELLDLIKVVTGWERAWNSELSDAAIVLCYETMLSYLIPRFSELLKRAAEDALVGLTRSIFCNFAALKRHDDPVHIQIPWRKTSASAKTDEKPPPEHHDASASPVVQSGKAAELGASVHASYSRALCDALIGFVGRVLQFSDRKQMERLLPLAIKMTGAMVESAGAALFSDEAFACKLSDPVLKDLIRLFGQLSGPSADLLSGVLVFIFAKHRHALHGQYVFFLNHLMALARGKAATGPPANPQAKAARPPHREAVLDILVYLSKEPSFLSDLYGLYECDPLYSFSVEDLAGCLSEQTGKHVERAVVRKAFLCMANISRHVAEGCALLKNHDNGTGKQLHDNRLLKALHSKAADVFNTNPKDIDGFLVDHDLLPPEHSREELARQIRRISGINKKKLGQWLAKPGHEDIAKAFIADLDFTGKRIDDAMRLMLATFRLPGESQEINRIMEAFAAVLHEQCSADPAMSAIFANSDAVYVMAYSVIMLNTDQHNPQYKGRRMTEDDFIKNNRGNNNGRDYDHDFLRAVYQSIKHNEILMPEEHDGDAAFNHRYSEIVSVAKVHHPGDRLPVEVSLVAGELLPLVWEHFMRAATECFESQLLQHNSEQKMVVASVLSILHDLASSAASLDQPDRMDELVLAMWNVSHLERFFHSKDGNGVAKYLAKLESGRELVRLLVDLFKRHGEVIRTGWKQLVDLVFILHESRVISSESFTAAPRLPEQDQQKRAQSPNPDSLLASLTSYLYTAEAVPASAALTPAEADLVNRVAEFLSKTCHFEDIFRESRMLSGDALAAMLAGFLSIVSPGVHTTWSRSTRSLSIDICIYCALQNRDRLGAVWSVLFAGLTELAIRGSDELLREHAVIGLGRLALKMAEREEDADMRANLLAFLQFLCNFDPEVFHKIAQPVLAIILKIVELDASPGRTWRLLSGSDIWPPYFTIMSLVSRHRPCAPYTLGLLMAATTEQARPLFPLDFFSEYLDLLSAFIASCTDAVPAAKLPVSPVDMAKTAMKRLCDLEAFMRQQQVGDTLFGFLLPIHSAVAMQCCHPSRDIRQQAVVTLHRLVMGGGWRQAEDVVGEFNAVLFPLLDELQSDAVLSLNGTIEDTQMGAASLVSKVFLNNVLLMQQGDPHTLTKVLLVMLGKLLGFLRFRSETLREGVPETVKNVLFVLSATNALGADQWAQVWSLVDQVLPDLKRDLGHASSPAAAAEPDEPPHRDTLPPAPGVPDSLALIQPVASPSAIHYV